jgi:hypothetical protein
LTNASNGSGRPTVDDYAAALDVVAEHAANLVALWVAFRLVGGEPTPEDATLVLVALDALDDALSDASKSATS